jgi:hypothetical protein
MSDLIRIYDQLVVALRAEEDSVTRQFFHPEFVVYEDPGMPYGGKYHGADGFIALRRKVRTYWKLEILAKCAEPDGDYLVVVLGLTGLPGGPVANLETMVNVVWRFREGKGVEARVLYYNTPPLAAAIGQAVARGITTNQ